MSDVITKEPPILLGYDDMTRPLLTQRQLIVMAAACGISAANIYYNQPLLNDFASSLHATVPQAGMVATASQVGYGVGLFFFLPLGDVFERRTLVLWLTCVCTVLVAFCAAAPNIHFLIILHLLVGITAMSAQLLIPLAVDLTPAKDRGRTVGLMMGGLLCGLLVARVFSGALAHWFGWRSVYIIVTGVMIVTAIVLRIEMPKRPPTLRMKYGELMGSVLQLAVEQKRAWAPSLVSGISFGCFSAFWAVLSFLMHDRFGRGAAEAGMFGIVGLIGAAGAPLAGKLSDKKGSAFTVTIALSLTLIAFIMMSFWVSIASLILGVLMMDLGVQSVQVAEQSLVVSLVPEARSRVNTLYMVCRFIGAAAGSAIGVLAWTHASWTGVCITCAIGLAIAMLLHQSETKMYGRPSLEHLPDLVTE